MDLPVWTHQKASILCIVRTNSQHEVHMSKFYSLCARDKLFRLVGPFETDDECCDYSRTHLSHDPRWQLIELDEAELRSITDSHIIMSPEEAKDSPDLA